jgi:hypothetical protein
MPMGSTGTGDVAPFLGFPHFRQNALPEGSSAEQERQRGMGVFWVSISQQQIGRTTFK